MNYLIILLCLTIALIRFKILKLYLDPGAYFAIFWAILVSLASLRLYGLDGISEFGYFVMFIGILGYFFGDLLYVSLNKNKGKFQTNLGVKNKEFKLNERLLFVLYIITLIILFYNLINVIKLLIDGNSYLAIRTMYSNQGSTNLADGYNEVLRSALNVVLVQFISTPVVYASISILFVNLFMGNNNKWMFKFTVLMAILWILTSGGRSIILWSIINFFFCSLYFKKKVKLKKRTKRLLIFSCLIILIIVVMVTSSRRIGKEFNILRQIYIYFPVALKNFDVHLSNISKMNIQKTYGLSSFYGFVYPIIFIIHNIFGMKYPDLLIDARYYSFTMLEKDVSVGNGIWMNAYATIFYQPYLDGGILGVFLFLAFFGFLCKCFYAKICKGINERNLVIYLYLMQKILFSHVRFYFTQTQQALALLIILIVYVYFPKDKFMAGKQ
ncbi:MAG: O-antigen ligase [Peptoniphilaceae bacterium]|nr:O-antigen ligase [Peptoniphilaceae bacterium]MDY6018296.1 O-antigen polymerase [Anaerococcus sp.]